MFITFEGIEGAGKTTQIKLLYEFLKSRGNNVVITKEPGGTELGKRIRDLILNPNIDDKPIGMSEIFMYLADRAHHVETFIKSYLKKNYFVISDRYIDSTIAYQGYGRLFDIQILEYLNNIATQGLKPDITFILDLEVENGLNRIKNRNLLDRIEQESFEFHSRIRKGFLEISKKENRFCVINSNDTIENVFEKIKNIIVDKIKIEM
ncbi:MAG: thymidylate kinase [Candidatus Sericytochromatia bacterium]|nr:MAG: thymidylate kinase [Candidatus Sericytochromatia bacterium]